MSTGENTNRHRRRRAGVHKGRPYKARREVISKVEAHGDVEKVGVKVGQTFLSALLIVLLPEYRQACAASIALSLFQ